MTRALLNKLQGCFAGIAIGDAIGAPWEMMDWQKILQKTDGSGVKSFMCPQTGRFGPTAHLVLGDTTDDWQLTKAVAISLIETGGFSLLDIARRHVEEAEKCDFGWGGTTRKAVAELKAYFISKGKAGRNPYMSALSEGKNTGCGNGVAMKVAPIALLNSLSSKKITDNQMFHCIRYFGQMTHSDIRASIAAFAVGTLLKKVFLESMEDNFFARKEALLLVLEEVRKIEKDFFKGSESDSFSFRLKVILDNRLFSPVLNISSLRERIGTGCFVLESVPFAMAVFLRHPCDFRAGVLEAVNAGGDTDSTASMVGALIGANCGLYALPYDWFDFVPVCGEVEELGARFYEKFYMEAFFNRLNTQTEK